MRADKGGRTCKCVCNCRTLIEFRFQAEADEKISLCYRDYFHALYLFHVSARPVSSMLKHQERNYCNLTQFNSLHLYNY